MFGLPRYVVHGAGGGGNAPSLNFNFVDGSAFSPQITFTRASTATYFDATGTLQSAAIDVPRFDYNPATLAARGFLIEEARTNSLLQSDWAGAVGGSPGTAPTSWTLGTVTGTPTTTLVTSIYGASDQAVLFSGVTGDRLWYQQSINVTSGTTYTATIFCETITGTPGDVIQVVAGTAARTIIADNALNPASGTRASVVFSATSTGTIVLRYGIGTDTTIAADATAQLSRPQVEAGAFSTSYIPTTTTALTRSADVASVNTLSPWFNQAEGSLYLQGKTDSPVVNTYIGIIQGSSSVFDGAGAFIDTAGTRVVMRVRDISVGDSSTIGSQVITLGQQIKVAVGYYDNAGSAGGSVNGNTAVTGTRSMPVCNALYIGCNGGPSAFFNGWIQLITYYPRRLTDDQLQQITA